MMFTYEDEEQNRQITEETWRTIQFFNFFLFQYYKNENKVNASVNL